MELGVIGAGYVGLVTAACLAKLGHDVTCVERDAARVERLSRGELPITEPGLDQLVVDGLGAGRLRFTSDAAALRRTRLAIIAVGTLDAAGEWTADLVRRAVFDIAADPAAPRSVIIRSTLLPGTAAGLMRELTAMDAGVRLAMNPEFTRESTAVADFLGPDRVVIGSEDPTGQVVDELRQVYDAMDAPVLVTDLTSAEMIKVASNVFLATKITFANELARLCEAAGARVADVVDGIGLDARIGRSFLNPGPGYGGSCLPAQARALPAVSDALGVQTPLIAAVARSNALQADWLMDRGEAALGDELRGYRVAVLGMTFKAGTDDLRDSPALRLIAGLAGRGAAVSAYDPIATATGTAALATDGIEIMPTASVVEACRGVDVVFIATEWPEFGSIDWSRVRAAMRGEVLVDGRAIVDVATATEAGLRVVGLRRRSGELRTVVGRVPVGPGLASVAATNGSDGLNGASFNRVATNGKVATNGSETLTLLEDHDQLGLASAG